MTDTRNRVAESLKRQAQETEERISEVDDLSKAIDYQVDSTMTKWGGLYDFEQHTITTRVGEYYQDHQLDLCCALQHEEQHRQNDKNGLHDYYLSYEQYYKVDMADEISANMAELIGLRHEYIKNINAGKSREEALKVFDAWGEKVFFL